ncbi:MAG: pilus assembly protein TadG-related protein [Terracidiphilus sp.]
MQSFGEDHGQSTILMAAFVGLLSLGFVALALDVGFLFHTKRMAQGAADAAALAAAEELPYGATAEASAANAMAKMNGFDTTRATNPATVTLNSPPKSGNYAGSSAGTYVEAIVSEPVPTLFLAAFKGSAATITVAARAVAGGGLSSPTCICLEEPTGMGLNMSNSAQILAPQCGVTVDSSSNNAVGIVGSAGLKALSLGTVSSSWDNSGNINNNGTISSSTKVVQGIANQCKPTLTVPTLPNGLPCYSNPIQGWTAANNYTGAYTLPLAGETASNGIVCYTSLDTSQSSSVTFSPGYTYYIQGNFATGGGSPLTGNGVTFYVGGTVNIANGVTSNLSSPTVGTNPPVPQTLFYAMGNNVTIQGGSSSNFSGLVYAPNAAVTLNNGTGTTLNMDFVSQSLSISGGATLNSYATSNLGTLNLSVAKVAE